MKTTHTHRGTCQACGRIHAVDNTSRLVAKHGYTVDFGYFHGVCPGGRSHKPAELDVSFTQDTIATCERTAKLHDQAAAELRTGASVPQTFERYNPTKIVEKRNVWGRLYNAKGGYDTLPIDLATTEEFEKAKNIAIYKNEADARSLRAHAKGLTEHVLPRLGQPLYDANEEKPVIPDAVVDVKAAKVEGTFKTKAARKTAMTKLSRKFDEQRKMLQNLCLEIPHAFRTKAQDEVYWGPSELHHWRAKHSAKALEVFPQAAEIVANIEALVKAREAVKAAP